MEYIAKRKNKSKGKCLDRNTDEIHADVTEEKESKKKHLMIAWTIQKSITKYLNDIAVMIKVIEIKP